MSSETCCTIHEAQAPTVIPQSVGCWSWAVDTVEIGVGILCSVVTWDYTVQNDINRGYRNVRQGQQHAGEHGTDDFLLYPSPGLMLFSCLVFGCSVSSFTQRRQSKDPLQIFVYVALLGAAALAGYARQESAHLILLGYLPWATCAAMTLSISGHSLYRLFKAGTRATKDEEKAQLLGG